jgi:hypothetical protein
LFFCLSSMASCQLRVWAPNLLYNCSNIWSWHAGSVCGWLLQWMHIFFLWRGWANEPMTRDAPVLCSPNSVDTLRGSYGRRKGPGSRSRVCAYATGILIAPAHTKVISIFNFW